jgi:hypothetical protein
LQEETEGVTRRDRRSHKEETEGVTQKRQTPESLRETEGATKKRQKGTQRRNKVNH